MLPGLDILVIRLRVISLLGCILRVMRNMVLVSCIAIVKLFGIETSAFVDIYRRYVTIAVLMCDGYVNMR